MIPAVLILNAMTPAMDSARIARFFPGPGGEPPVWLVAGPLSRSGWEKPPFDEASLAPSEGDAAAEGKRWIADPIDINIGIDFRALLRSEAEAVVYAYAEFEHPTATDALLLFGSDDGAQVFVDGKKVFETRDYRGVRKDQDRVPIRLNAGVTRVLFKVDQYRLGWGLTARVVGRDGAPLPNLRVIQRLRTGDDPWRVGVGKAGSLDTLLGQRARRVRETAERWSRAFPDRVTSNLTTALNARMMSPAAFASMDDLNAARSAEIDRIRTAYDAARAPMVAEYQTPRPLLPNVKPASQNFVRVMRQGRYFQLPSGKPWTPIGYNHNPDWSEFARAHVLSADYDPQAADRWMKKLAASGVNLVRLMIETPPSGNWEEKMGVVRPEHVLWIDAIVLAARKHGIRLWITPWDTFWMNLRWQDSPWWAPNGGPIPLDKKIEFYTNPVMIAAQKRRMDYLIERYGNLDTVWAWEIMNEADIWWDPPAPVLKTWTDDMIAHVRQKQMSRWGAARRPLFTMSFAEPMTKGAMAEIQYQTKGFDFATNHLYIGRTRNPKGAEDPKGAGEDFASGIRHALTLIKDRRPVLDGESGPIDEWIRSAADDERLFEAMSWAHLFAGGAGPGTRWPYRNPHHLTDGMLATLEKVRAFSDGVPWAKLAGEWREIPGGFRSSLGGVLVRVTGPRDLAFKGRYRVFDLKKGVWLGPERAGSPKVPAGVDAGVYIVR